MNILSVFSSSKCSLFHNSNIFLSCIIHILYTGVLKLKKNHSGAKSLSLGTSFNNPLVRVGLPVLNVIHSDCLLSPFIVLSVEDNLLE